MKTTLYRIGILLGLSAMAACSAEKNLKPESEPQTRTVTVTAAATKTTIEYEGSDVSHLVWCDGDEVAYCTEVNSDTFKKAVVTSNAFKAEIPSSAQNIVVIWPAGNNEGKTLAQASSELASETTCNIDEDFDGALLPMMAVASVPSDSDNIDVEYNCLASVIRFTVYPANTDAAESLMKITVSANESMVGTYAMSHDGYLAFNGSGKEAVVNVTGSSESILLTEEPEAYVVVNRASYTGVDVKVDTDLGTYVFADGAMDVSRPDRSLYRVKLDLSTKSPVPDTPKKYFTVVTDLSDITDDGTYLIATDKGDTEYYITDNKPTDTSNYYWLMGVAVSHDDYGISFTEDLMTYVCNITKHDGGYKVFFPNLVEQGNTGLEMIAQGGSGDFSRHDGEGKVWFVTTDTADGYSDSMQPRRYWDLNISSDGTALLINKYDRGNGKNAYYKFCTDHSWFTLCHEGEKFKDIKILKLTEN